MTRYRGRTERERPTASQPNPTFGKKITLRTRKRSLIVYLQFIFLSFLSLEIPFSTRILDQVSSIAIAGVVFFGNAQLRQHETVLEVSFS